jgi:tetratricopeptide (TPR) repeat protein
MPPLTRAAPAILAFSLGISLTSVATAQPDAEKDKKAEAIQLFEQSADLYRQGKFGEAADLLERAYAMHPEPVLLYNLGRAYDGMGENEKAVDAYKRYLDQVPEAKDKGALSRRIETLEKQIERDKQLAEDEKRRQQQLDQDKDKGSTAPPPPRTAGPGFWPWVVTGVGAATIGAGLFVGIQAKSKRSDAQDNPVSRDAQNDYDSAKSMASTANVLLIAGTIITAGGVTWALLTRKKGEAPAASALHLTVTPSSVQLGGTL